MNLRIPHIAASIGVTPDAISNAIASYLAREELPPLTGRAREYSLVDSVRIALGVKFRRHGACPAEVQGLVTPKLVGEVISGVAAYIVFRADNDGANTLFETFKTKAAMLNFVGDNPDVATIHSAAMHQALRDAKLNRMRAGETRSGWTGKPDAGVGFVEAE